MLRGNKKTDRNLSSFRYRLSVVIVEIADPNKGRRVVIEICQHFANLFIQLFRSQVCSHLITQRFRRLLKIIASPNTVAD